MYILKNYKCVNIYIQYLLLSLSFSREGFVMINSQQYKRRESWTNKIENDRGKMMGKDRRSKAKRKKKSIF